MSVKERFNQMLDAVVAGVNDIAAQLDRPADDEFAARTFGMFALAISNLSEPEREEMLREIEDGLLRRAVNNFPPRHAPTRTAWAWSTTSRSRWLANAKLLLMTAQSEVRSQVRGNQTQKSNLCLKT
jgi:hypothetical protein